jgi:hypothetical protein
MLAALCNGLADANVNILALSVLDSSDMGIVRLVVDKPDDAARVLTEEALPFSESDVLLVKVQNKVGMLARLAGKLADQKINISFVYGSSSAGKGQAYVVVCAAKLDAAEKALSGR